MTCYYCYKPCNLSFSTNWMVDIGYLWEEKKVFSSSSWDAHIECCQVQIKRKLIKNNFPYECEHEQVRTILISFFYRFCYYCNKSSANLNSAISFSTVIVSFSSLGYFNNISQACISDNIMSFLSLQRLWYESTNEYVTFLFLSLHPQVLAIMSKSSSVCAIFSLCDHLLDLATILRPFHRCNHDLTCKTRNSKWA